jgi:hypothetical protein
MMRLLLISAAALVGCGGGDDVQTTEKLLDTGWFVDTATGDGLNCQHQVVLTEPEDGALDWYWRDFPRVYVETNEDPSKYEVFLVDEEGVRLRAEQSWPDEDSLSFEVQFVGGLKASHTYQMIIRDCAGERVVSFTTSPLGAPLQSGPQGLVNSTYVLDLATAEWVQPPSLGPLLQLYFTTPVLLGVESADSSSIDFLGAPGEIDPFEGILQDTEQQTWDFDGTGFTDSPYFQADVDEVNFRFDGLDIPVFDFSVAGTFAADGSEFGGGALLGNADTRNLGVQLGEPDNLAAMCGYAESLGILCKPCPDGEPYCLDLEVQGVTGTLVPGLTLQRR